MKKIFTLAMVSALALTAGAAPMNRMGRAAHIKPSLENARLIDFKEAEFVKKATTVSNMVNDIKVAEDPVIPGTMTQYYLGNPEGETKDQPTGCAIKIKYQGDGVVWLDGMLGNWAEPEEGYQPIVGDWTYTTDEVTGKNSYSIFVESGQALWIEDYTDMGLQFSMEFYWVDNVHNILMSGGSMLDWDAEEGAFFPRVFDEIETSKGDKYYDVRFDPVIVGRIIKTSNPQQYPMGGMLSFYGMGADNYSIFTPNSTITYDLWAFDKDVQDLVEDPNSPIVLPVYLEWNENEVSVLTLDPEIACNVVKMEYSLEEDYAEFYDAKLATFGDEYTFYACAIDLETMNFSSYLETQNMSADGKTFDFGEWAIADPSSRTFLRGASTYLKIELGKVTGINNVAIEDVLDENAPVEYFNLQGMRVMNPENGMFVRRQGKKAEKVLL